MLELIKQQLLQQQLADFFEAGGVILPVLAFVAFFLWLLLLQRLWFRFITYSKLRQRCIEATTQRRFLQSLHEAYLALQFSMSLIRTTISVCPLLGLAGTVLGMIEIFDVIAYRGVNNSQLLASGVSRAILPTMAGMVIAISSMLVFSYIQRWVIKQQNMLSRLSLIQKP